VASFYTVAGNALALFFPGKAFSFVRFHLRLKVVNAYQPGQTYQVYTGQNHRLPIVRGSNQFGFGHLRGVLHPRGVARTKLMARRLFRNASEAKAGFKSVITMKRKKAILVVE
jgi:hypothetical protein